MVTVFFSILNQMEIHLVQNRKKNFYHDHIPFNVKGIGNIVFSVYVERARSQDIPKMYLSEKIFVPFQTA